MTDEPGRASPPAPEAEDWRAAPPAGPAPSAPPPDRPAPAEPALPVTMPVTLSAWLIGIGAAVGALGAIVGLFGALGAIDLLLLLALAGIAITVFFSASVPEIPNLRLATLAVVLVGFGVALDRIFIGAANAGTLLLLLGTAAASIGAIILELGRDQPLGGQQP